MKPHQARYLLVQESGQWSHKLARRVVDRKCAEEKYDGAELGVTEVIQGTASVRAMIELTLRIGYVTGVPDVRFEEENIR